MPRPSNLFVRDPPPADGKRWSPAARYVSCGGCDSMHAVEFDGDCRDDAARLSVEEIIARHGNNWSEQDGD